MGPSHFPSSPLIALPGFFPDPSICRRGDEFFIVNSTFGYFPGLPVHRSTDLVNWQLAGYALNRPEQLPLAGAAVTKGGIYAPTIRYHDGRFWIITTNVTHGGHFIVTATDPAGPWSDPVWIDAEHQGGIDPDLFWEDDGTCWVYCTRRDRPPAEPHHGIWRFQIDPLTGKGIGGRHFIWGGTGGKSPEGPHIYKRGAFYYLLVAEGGTEYGHMVTLARSPSLHGPWEPCPHNPILTHRSIGSPVQSIGHGDFIEAPDGSWWITFLGVRPVGYPPAHHLGRETFLAPVAWKDDGWPVVNQGRRITVEPTAAQPETYSFQPGQDLWQRWSCLRDPRGIRFSLDASPGSLRLWGSALGLDGGRPSPAAMARAPWEDTAPLDQLTQATAFLGIRQRHFITTVSVTLDYTPAAPGEQAGLAVFMSEQCHYTLGIETHDGARVAVLTKRVLDLETRAASAPLPAGPLRLVVEATAPLYTFAVLDAAGHRHELGTGLSRLLSTELAGGFTGVFLGLYTTAPTTDAPPADFSDFSYVPA